MTLIIQSHVFHGNEPTSKPPLDLEEAIVIDCRFDQYVHEGAPWTGAVFVGCTFKDVDLYWGHFFRTRFIRCTLENVDFRGANLEETAFVGSRLVRCDFSNDNLGGTTDVSTVSFHETERIECRFAAPNLGSN